MTNLNCKECTTLGEIVVFGYSAAIFLALIFIIIHMNW